MHHYVMTRLPASTGWHQHSASELRCLLFSHVVSTTFSLTCTYNPVCCKFDNGWDSGCKYSQNNKNPSPGDPEDPQKLLRSACGERGSMSRGWHNGTHTVIVTRGHGMVLCLGCIAPPASGDSWLTVCFLAFTTVLTTLSFYGSYTLCS